MVDAETLSDDQIKKKTKTNSKQYCIKQFKIINIRPVQLVRTFLILNFFLNLDFFIILSRF